MGAHKRARSIESVALDALLAASSGKNKPPAGSIRASRVGQCLFWR
jgi:hypothetical protein